MEEADRLDDITLEELADGMVAHIFSEWPSPRATFGSRLIFTFPLSPRRQSSQSPRRDTSCYPIISSTRMAGPRPPSSSSTGPQRARPASLPYTQVLCWISRTLYAQPMCSSLLTDVFYTRWTSPKAWKCVMVPRA